MRLGIDLDSTLVNLPTIDKVSSDLELNIKPTDFHDWNYSQFPKEFRERAMQLFRDSTFMCNLLPFYGAQEKVKEWSIAGHELVLITARHEDIRHGTIRLVNRLFPEISTIDFVDQNASKSGLMVKYKLDRWIDDSPHEVENSLSLGIVTHLISNDRTPYNHHVKLSRPLLRVSSSVANITKL